MKYKDYKVISEIKKGWSTDNKYCVQSNEGHKFLLRASEGKDKDRYLRFISYLNKVNDTNVNIDELIEYEIIDGKLYAVYRWIEGVDVEDSLLNYSKEKQYNYGKEAGRMLREIQSIDHDFDLDWEEYFNKKIDSKIQQYLECEDKYNNDYLFLDYLKNNRNLLKGREVTFQHGDYHVGNMMFEDDKLVVIDFDRASFGDPWEELNRIVWCVALSNEFSTGMVDGYFEDDVPEKFWRLLVLYICSNTIGSLPWAYHYDDNQVQVMKKQANDVLSWYDDFNKVLPNWYLSELKCK